MSNGKYTPIMTDSPAPPGELLKSQDVDAKVDAQIWDEELFWMLWYMHQLFHGAANLVWKLIYHGPHHYISIIWGGGLSGKVSIDVLRWWVTVKDLFAYFPLLQFQDLGGLPETSSDIPGSSQVIMPST